MYCSPDHRSLVTASENPLNALVAFKAFSERVQERCDEPPEVVELTTVGSYGL